MGAGTGLAMFQFHKGAIKTFGLLKIVVAFGICFNSIKVRLRLQRLTYIRKLILRFNSIKVRLRPKKGVK